MQQELRVRKRAATHDFLVCSDAWEEGAGPKKGNSQSRAGRESRLASGTRVSRGHNSSNNSH